MTATIDALVREYANAIVATSEMSLSDPVSKHNVQMNRASRAWKKLVSKYGDEGRDAFCQLLGHPNAVVRVNAAALLLRYRNRAAMSVLMTEAKKGPSLLAFTAQQALQRWEEGDWHLDPLE